MNSVDGKKELYDGKCILCRGTAHVCSGLMIFASRFVDIVEPLYIRAGREC
jgi:hypothetical protein